MGRGDNQQEAEQYQMALDDVDDRLNRASQSLASILQALPNHHPNHELLSYKRQAVEDALEVKEYADHSTPKQRWQQYPKMIETTLGGIPFPSEKAKQGYQEGINLALSYQHDYSLQQ